MKVVCEGCSTKYSIGDEKVAGKVFKIRCKKCSRVIIVRGEPAAAAPPVAAVPEWHAVQDGRQLGPFDSGELQRRRAAGELDDDSYVWREGFTDWQPLGAVDELRPALSMPMPIVDEPAHGEPAHAAGALFGGAAAHAATSNGAEASRLRGERNESSVLFTLDNLARLAAPAPAQAAASPSSGARGAAGAAGGEGSGLIDIRALARTYTPVAAARGGDGARAGGGRSGSNIGSMADLPVFAAATFVEPGVLVPRAPQRDRRLVVGLVASVGMLAICAALLLVVMLTRDGEPTITTAPLPPPGPRVAAVEPPVPPRTVSPAVIEPPAVPRVAMTETTPAPARTTTTTTPAPARTTTTTTTTPARTTTTTPARTTTTTPARTTTTTPPEQAKCDQVTCIVNGNDSDCCRALQGNALTPTRPAVPTASSQLPESLDRAAINEGLATISTKSCGGVAPAGSLVKAHLKVSAAGAVTAVTVQSSPDAALSACMVAQIQKGRFKKTQRGGSFAYPWRL